MRNTVPSIHALLAVALFAGGCADGSEKPNSAETSNVRFALTTAQGVGAGYCVTSGIAIAKTDAIPVPYTPQIAGDATCAATEITASYFPGHYLIRASQAITCSPPNDGNQAEYVSCQIAQDVAFTVAFNQPETVEIPVTFHYRNASVTVILGVGIVELCLAGPIAVNELCGTDACEPDEICYTLDDDDETTPPSDPACFQTCTDETDCPSDQDCMPIVPQGQLGQPSGQFEHICVGP